MKKGIHLIFIYGSSWYKKEGGLKLKGDYGKTIRCFRVGGLGNFYKLLGKIKNKKD